MHQLVLQHANANTLGRYKSLEDLSDDRSTAVIRVDEMNIVSCIPCQHEATEWSTEHSPIRYDMPLSLASSVNSLSFVPTLNVVTPNPTLSSGAPAFISWLYSCNDRAFPGPAGSDAKRVRDGAGIPLGGKESG
jgi:hypothetical protein